MIRKLNNPYGDSYELTTEQRLEIFSELKAEFIEVVKSSFLFNQEEL